MSIKSLDVFDKGQVQSLVKAEWSVIRTCQNFIFKEWKSVDSPTRFSDDCCGMLFIDGEAFASNGHWLMRLKVDTTSVDPNVSHFFVKYENIKDNEDVQENVNPFDKFGLTIEDFRSLIHMGREYTTVAKVEELLGVIESNIAIVRSRRKLAFHGGIDPLTSTMGIRIESDNNTSDLYRVNIWGTPNYEVYPEFSLNLSYFYKILSILNEYYYWVSIEFDNNINQSVVIKGFEPNGDDHIGLEFVLAQYIVGMKGG